MIISKQEYAELRDNLELLCNESPISISLLDLNGKIIAINPATATVSGFEPEELIGKTVFDIPICSSDVSSEFHNELKDLISTKKIGPKDVQITKKNGNLSWVSVHFTLVEIEKKLFVLVLTQDINQRKLLEEKLKKSEELILKENKKLKELDKIRKNFLDTASHELKTPLTSILGAVQLLSKKELDSDSLELLEIIENGGLKLKSLIFNFLNVPQFESKENFLQKEKGNLIKIIKRCVDDFKFLSSRREQEISLNLPKQLYLSVDKEKFERVLANLLSNAIKYTPRKGKVQIVAKKIKNYVEISIKDTGIGITKEELPYLFKKYSTNKRSVQEIEVLMKGSGLGLYISKQIVELHNGQIWAESQGKNKGSTFTVRIPIN